MFTAKQLTKAGFAHDFQKDFTDDGTRFQIWVKDGVTISYAKDDGRVYLSIRTDYNRDISYENYIHFPSYRLIDEFNGVDEDEVDMDRFVQNVEAVAADVNKFRAGEKVFETDVKKMTKEELKDYLARKYTCFEGKSDKVFRLAWDYGHSAGHHEVEEYYSELVQLAR